MLWPAAVRARPCAKRRHWRWVVVSALRHAALPRGGGSGGGGGGRGSHPGALAHAARVLALLHWRSAGRLWALKTRTIRRWLAVALLALAAIVATCVGVAWWLSTATPRWWQPPDARDAGTHTLAEAVENGTITTLNQVRPGEAPWAMSITQEAANAWLAARLRPWLLSQAGLSRWPDGIDRVMVRFEPGLVRVAVELLHEGRRQIVSFAFTPEVAPAEGAAGGAVGSGASGLWLRPSSISLGRLALPPGWVLSGTIGPGRSGGKIPADFAALPQTPVVLAALSGTVPLVRSATLRLPDARRLALVEIKSEEGRVVLTWRPAPGSGTR